MFPKKKLLKHWTIICLFITVQYSLAMILIFLKDKKLPIMRDSGLTQSTAFGRNMFPNEGCWEADFWLLTISLFLNSRRMTFRSRIETFFFFLDSTKLNHRRAKIKIKPNNLFNKRKGLSLISKHQKTIKTYKEHNGEWLN